jgi:hypothetical protein
MAAGQGHVLEAASKPAGEGFSSLAGALAVLLELGSIALQPTGPSSKGADGLAVPGGGENGAGRSHSPAAVVMVVVAEVADSSF